MIHERYPHLFTRCWPVFWPWLWWQLIRLEAWVELEQRDLMIGVSRWGRVYILMQGDAPRATDHAPALAWRLAAFDPMAAIPEAALSGCSSLRVALSGIAGRGVVCTVSALAGAGAALRLVAYPGCPPGLPSSSRI